jgi:hypothetical protein
MKAICYLSGSKLPSSARRINLTHALHVSLAVDHRKLPLLNPVPILFIMSTRMRQQARMILSKPVTDLGEAA